MKTFMGHVLAIKTCFSSMGRLVYMVQDETDNQIFSTFILIQKQMENCIELATKSVCVVCMIIIYRMKQYEMMTNEFKRYKYIEDT